MACARDDTSHTPVCWGWGGLSNNIIIIIVIVIMDWLMLVQRSKARTFLVPPTSAAEAAAAATTLYYWLSPQLLRLAFFARSAAHCYLQSSSPVFIVLITGPITVIQGGCSSVINLYVCTCVCQVLFVPYSSTPSLSTTELAWFTRLGQQLQLTDS